MRREVILEGYKCKRSRAPQFATLLVAIENAQLFAKTLHAAPGSRLDGTEWKSRLTGDFTLGEAVKERHLDDSPLIWGEPEKKSADNAGSLRFRTVVLGTGNWTAMSIQILIIVMVEDDLGRAQLVQSPASRDGDDPTQCASPCRVKSICLTPNLHVYLLRCVLRSGSLSEHSQDQPIHEEARMVVKLGHCPLVLKSDLAEQPVQDFAASPQLLRYYRGAHNRHYGKGAIGAQWTVA